MVLYKKWYECGGNIFAYRLSGVSWRALSRKKLRTSTSLPRATTRPSHHEIPETMEVDQLEEVSASNVHFNGAVPIKRARTDLVKTSTDDAQLRRRKEAEKQYGRGRKIPCRYFPSLIRSAQASSICLLDLPIQYALLGCDHIICS